MSDFSKLTFFTDFCCSIYLWQSLLWKYLYLFCPFCEQYEISKISRLCPYRKQNYCSYVLRMGWKMPLTYYDKKRARWNVSTHLLLRIALFSFSFWSAHRRNVNYWAHTAKRPICIRTIRNICSDWIASHYCPANWPWWDR